MRKCMCGFFKNNWESILVWGVKKLRGLIAVKCKVALGAIVYHIWMQRNHRIFGGQVISKENLLKFISWDLKVRVASKNGFKDSDLNRALCSVWVIPNSVLGKGVCNCVVFVCLMFGCSSLGEGLFVIQGV